MKVITKTIHAYLNYPVAFSLMALPFALSLGQSHPMAKWLGVGTGVAAFVLTLLTDHKTGVIRVVPHSEHFAVDFLVGVMFVVAPFALGFSGIDARFYWANGGAVLAVVGLHQSQQCRATVAA